MSKAQKAYHNKSSKAKAAERAPRRRPKTPVAIAIVIAAAVIGWIGISYSGMLPE